MIRTAIQIRAQILENPRTMVRIRACATTVACSSRPSCSSTVTSASATRSWETTTTRPFLRVSSRVASWRTRPLEWQGIVAQDRFVTLSCHRRYYSHGAGAGRYISPLPSKRKNPLLGKPSSQAIHPGLILQQDGARIATNEDNAVDDRYDCEVQGNGNTSVFDDPLSEWQDETCWPLQDLESSQEAHHWQPPAFTSSSSSLSRTSTSSTDQSLISRQRWISLLADTAAFTEYWRQRQSRPSHQQHQQQQPTNQLPRKSQGQTNRHECNPHQSPPPVLSVQLEQFESLWREWNQLFKALVEQVQQQQRQGSRSLSPRKITELRDAITALDALVHAVLDAATANETQPNHGRVSALSSRSLQIGEYGATPAAASDLHVFPAAFAGMTAWARMAGILSTLDMPSSSCSQVNIDDVRHDKAATKIVVPATCAENILTKAFAITKGWDRPTSLNGQRKLYHAMLWAWSRQASFLAAASTTSTSSSSVATIHRRLGEQLSASFAADRALFWLQHRQDWERSIRMQRAKKQQPVDGRPATVVQATGATNEPTQTEAHLVDDACYHRVMNACAAAGRPETVQELIRHATRTSQSTTTTTTTQDSNRAISMPPALFYDALIYAYQIQFTRQQHNQSSFSRSASLQDTSTNNNHPAALALQAWQQQLHAYEHAANSFLASSNMANARDERMQTESIAAMKPLSSTLARVLTMVPSDPDRVRSLLQQALYLDETYTGVWALQLVNTRIFLSAILTFVKADGIATMIADGSGNKPIMEDAKDAVKIMMELHRQDLHRTDRYKPTLKIFGALLSGYARYAAVPAAPDSLSEPVGQMGTHAWQQALAILEAMEDRFLIRPATESDRILDCTAYNLFMSGMLQGAVRGRRRHHHPSGQATVVPNAVPHCEELITRMKRRAQAHNRPALLPDRVTYTLLMKALIQSGEDGFHHHVASILSDMVRHEGHRPEAQPDLKTYATVLYAFDKSKDHQAWLQAEQLFRTIQRPNTRCCNVMINLYRKAGQPEAAEGLLQSMNQNSESSFYGKPDTFSYTMALRAWRDSQYPDRLERAMQLYDDMVDRAKGGNERCKPNEWAVSSILQTLSSRTTTSECLGKQNHILGLEFVERANDSVMGTNSLQRDASFWHSPVVVATYINACKETTVDDGHVRHAVWQCALERYEGLGSRANHEVYNAMLEATYELLGHEPDLRTQEFKRIFYNCTDEGHLSRLVLNTVWRLCPPDLYLLLTLQNARKIPSMDNVPKGWTRNAPRM